MIYTCSNNGETAEIEASSVMEAAKIFTSDYDPEDKTYWVNVCVSNKENDDVSHVKVTIEPNIPECYKWNDETEEYDKWEHKWKESTVRGNSGGVLITEQCIHCGCKKTTNTWDFDPENGEQGLTSIQYECQY